MKKFVMAFLFAFAMPLMALAQDAGVAVVAAAPAAAPSVNDGLGLIPMLVAAVQGGHWSVFAALLIMVLVWGLTKAPVLSDLIKGEAKIWVAMICGVVLSIAVEAFSSGDWLQAVLHGLGTGAAASGLWELIGKKVAGRPVT